MACAQEYLQNPAAQVPQEHLCSKYAPAARTFVENCLSLVSRAELLGVEIHTRVLALHALHMIILHSTAQVKCLHSKHG